MSTDIPIRTIRASDLAAFKSLRLDALREHPEAFGMDYDEDLQQPDSVWVERVRKAIEDPAGAIFLADAGAELAGMIGVYRINGAKLRHAANIWGVYVRPQYRGQKLADRMIGQALEWCRLKKVRLVRLRVASGNTKAVRCYMRCGFLVSGVSHEEIRVGDVYHDELMMWRSVSE